MSVSGVSGSNAYLAYSSMRLHAAGCSCPLCSPQPVATSPSAAVPAVSKAGLNKADPQLSEEELAQVRQLQARDRAVRQHEQAHMGSAGGLATSGPSYTYQRGPDGVNYAIGGEVNIDVSPGRTPEETLEKAKTIERAALAPRDPSGADRAVAAQARKMALEAQQKIAVAEAKASEGSSEPGAAANDKAPSQSAPEKTAGRIEQAYQPPSLPTSLISAYA